MHKLMANVGRSLRMAFCASHLFSGCLNNDADKPCRGKSTKTPTKEVPTTSVKICTVEKTANDTDKPVLMPASSTTPNAKMRGVRNAHSKKAKVSVSPTADIILLSYSAFCLLSAAKKMPPDTSTSTP